MMSGTSLDGVDLALCHFKYQESKWTFEIIKAETIDYPENWYKTLKNAASLSSEDLIKTDRAYGSYLGKLARNFLRDQNIDFIASHGHTIFHQPSNGFTFQLGHGANIAAESNCMVINDFRSADVALGGTGAPLVPVGDELLFDDYPVCLNLGGFANISFKENQNRLAYDICPVNFILNKMCPPFDKNGEKGKQGKLIPELFQKLNELEYYKLPFPKSLGSEWIKDSFLPVLTEFQLAETELLHTVYEHIAYQVSQAINRCRGEKVLLSGGGAYNNYLVSLINKESKKELIIPEKLIVEFKEALIFAFLGVLRYQKEFNCLKSVTGAGKDNIGGAIWQLHP